MGKGKRMVSDERILIAMLTNDDPRLIPRGSIVIKIKEGEGGDVTKVGVEGVVIGGIYGEYGTEGEESGYLVWFSETVCPTLVVGSKIKEKTK